MTSTTFSAMLSCLLMAMVSAPAMGQRARDPGLGARVDRLVEGYRIGRHVPGIAIAVVRSGTVIKAKGYGFANLELKAPVTPETVFGLGSISKQFTATAIMQLVEDGKVRLDDRFEHHQLDVLRTIFADSLQSEPGAVWAYRNIVTTASNTGSDFIRWARK